MELMWTGLNSFVSGDITFSGHSSLIMAVIYGMVVFLEPIFDLFKGQYALVRIVTYSAFIFMAEYYWGIFLRSMGICPWVYSSKYNISNVIRLDYIILWMTAGYVYERLYFYLKAHSI